MMAELSLIPLGRGVSLRRDLARAVRLIDRSGLPYQVTPMGTVIQGDWDRVMALVKECHREILRECDRVITRIVIDDRKGETRDLSAKVAALEAELGKKLG